MPPARALWSALYAPAATPQRGAGDAAQGDGRGAQFRAGAGRRSRKQMIKAVPNTSLDDAKAWNAGNRTVEQVTEEVKIDVGM